MKLLFIRNTTFVAVLCSAAAVYAGSDKPVAGGRAAAPPASPVAVVRNHDAAFSLLIESFQQLQTAMIESDYQERLVMSEAVTDENARARVLKLAGQERDLRLAKLARQLQQMLASYDVARGDYQKQAGVVVPNSVNTDQAAAQLKQFVAFVPESAPKKVWVASRIVPSQTVVTGR